MIHNKRQFIVSGSAILILLLAAVVYAFLFGERSKPPLASADGQLACDSAQFNEYLKYMPLAGEIGISRQPASGTRAQQQKMLDNFEALGLPKDKTIAAVAHFSTGKVYTAVCESERCKHREMSKPRQACLIENGSDCVYMAMQFRQKRYCLLWPADQ